MTTQSQQLNICVKGDRVTIDGKATVVAGVATLFPMGQKGGQGPFVVIPGKPPLIRLVWTADGLLLFGGPLYEKGPQGWMLLSRVDLTEINIRELMDGAQKFGRELGQAQNSLSMMIGGAKLWWTDVGTAGGSNIPEDNEQDVVQGPAACIRFYHLTTDWQSSSADHLMYLGPQTQPNEFSRADGTAFETLWRGTIVDPEDVIEFVE